MWSFLIFRSELANLISEPDSEGVTDVFDDEKTDKDTENSHLTESFHQAHTHPPKDDAHKKTSKIAVPYG